jgi:NAD(P)-dependent dehydrogenase (short-subunit alcohol dehydrogenase family)
MNPTSLHPKTILITGATSGIGLSAATQLAESGHIILGVGRRREKIAAAEEALRRANPAVRSTFFICDLSSLTQVECLVASVIETLGERPDSRLDVLVNNAASVSSWFTLTEDGYEQQFMVNHLAPFRLTWGLMPLLENSPHGKVINVSSASHRSARIHWNDVMLQRRYGVLKAYKQSKLANVLFTYEVNRRIPEGAKVQAFAVDPGLVNTPIGAKGTTGLIRWFWNKRRRRGQSPEQAAATIVYLAQRGRVERAESPYWKDCRPVQPSRYARREDHARRLWELSCRLCGLSAA